MKEDIYNLVLTNDPKDKMLLTLPNEKMTKEEIQDVEFVYGFGVIEMAKKGYSSPTAIEIYRDILLGDGHYNPDAILLQTIPKLAKMNSGKMPGYKYLRIAKSSTKQEVLQSSIFERNFVDFKTDSINKRKNPYRTVLEIENNELGIQRQLLAMETLIESEIVIDDLERYLLKILSAHPDAFDSKKYSFSSAMRRMVRELDYLKYK
jgi:hypothetical protein